VLAGGDIPDLLECVDAGSLRVHAPAPLIFLCGGPYDATASTPKSLRDAFMRSAHKKPFDRHFPLLAEDLNAFFPRGQYKDILSFEADLAQISDLIILFSESFGSAAELGAFSMVPEIAPRLLVVIDDHYYGHNSFITLGPIRSLENAYGETSVCVLNRTDINISSIRNIETINISVFSERLGAAFTTRIKTAREHTTFNKERHGHVIKLIVGLIQHYGALTLDEIDLFLDFWSIKLSRDRLSDLLLCAEFANWTLKDKRGLSTYYLTTATNEALQYKLRADLPDLARFNPIQLKKERWRADIVEYWRRNEPDRFSSITHARGRLE
jgi:hypothetical protein